MARASKRKILKNLLTKNTVAVRRTQTGANLPGDWALYVPLSAGFVGS